MAGSDGFKKRMAERLAGWKLLPDGQIAYVPFIESAVFPMKSGVALALKFERRRTDQTDHRPEQLQLGLSPAQCRNLASQLLAAADFLDNEMTPPTTPAN